MDYKVTSGRGIIEAERKRLIDLPQTSKFMEWLDNREYPLDWMKRTFGDTLVEKDGLSRYVDGFNKCTICGVIPNIDEKILSLNYEPCYECDSIKLICKSCVFKFKELLKNE